MSAEHDEHAPPGSDPGSGHDGGHGDEHGHGHGPQSFWSTYVFSTDHKIIGMQFLFMALMFVVIGGALALGVRYELAWPQQDVPHKAFLPGKMTDPTAIEPNPALWEQGNKINFLTDVEQDGKTVPAKAEATVRSLGRFAVIVPAGTRVEGRQYPLGEHQPGFVNPQDVIAGYNYKYTFDFHDGAGEQSTQHVLAPPGTPVYKLAEPRVDEDGKALGEDPQYVLIAGSRRLQVYDDPIQLPLVKGKTQVNVHVAAQGVEIAPGEVKSIDAATVTLTADQLQYPKESLSPDGYGQLFTMHATIMVFFALMPALVGAFANFLIPLMIGARDMAFPKLNMLSFWIAVPAGILMVLSFWVEGGPAAGGWTMYPPLSEQGYTKSDLGTTLWAASIFLVGFSSIVGSVNYITTIINMRAPGMGMFRMPLSVWSLFITAILLLLATPVLAAAGIMLVLDRTLDTQFFQDTLLMEDGSRIAAGGQPLLWQHLFWFFGHPEVYILILPAMGMTSDILATFARKPIFGYKPMVYAICAIAGLGFIVWGHHMFQSGMNPILGTTFMASTIMIAVPSAIKTFNWMGTLWGGNIRFSVPMCWAVGFVAMFAIGGLSGIFMAAAPVDIHIHDTYFIVAHIHYVLFGGTIMAIFGGIYYWYPKMFGTKMNDRWGYVHFFMTLIALNGTFFMMHVLGVGGHPRRYASIMEYPTLTHLQPMNVLMSIFSLMLGMGQLAFFYNFFASLPRRLGRATVALLSCAWFVPMVIGLSAWAARDGLAKWPWLTERVAEETTYTNEAGATITGEWQFDGFWEVLGILAVVFTFLALALALWRGLPGRRSDLLKVAFFIVAFIAFLGSEVALNLDLRLHSEILNGGLKHWLAKAIMGVPDSSTAAGTVGSIISGLIAALICVAVVTIIIVGMMRSGRFAAICVLIPVTLFTLRAVQRGDALNEQGKYIYTIESHKTLEAETGAATAAAFVAVANADPQRQSAAAADAAATLKTKISELVDAQWKDEDTGLRDERKAEAQSLIEPAALLPPAAEDADHVHGAHGSHDPEALAASIIAPFSGYRDKEGAEWVKVWHDGIIAVGIGIIAAAAITGLVWLIWFIGGRLNMPVILGNALYVVALPAFLSPLLLKPDAYMWVGNVSLYESRWLFMILAAAPGLLYMLAVRPKDAYGAKAERNPWHANSLEWVATDSPPLAHGNFEEIPVVYRGPYEFSSPVVEDDYLPQNHKLPPGVVEPQAH